MFRKFTSSRYFGRHLLRVDNEGYVMLLVLYVTVKIGIQRRKKTSLTQESDLTGNVEEIDTNQQSL